jgi:ribosomal protein S21
MIVFTIKNAGESNDKLILRYKKMFFQTRSVNKIKTERYASRPLSTRKIRTSAIVRETYRALNKKGK